MYYSLRYTVVLCYLRDKENERMRPTTRREISRKCHFRMDASMVGMTHIKKTNYNSCTQPNYVRSLIKGLMSVCTFTAKKTFWVFINSQSDRSKRPVLSWCAHKNSHTNLISKIVVDRQLHSV
jgi:hypothetical protein